MCQITRPCAINIDQVEAHVVDVERERRTQTNMNFPNLLRKKTWVASKYFFMQFFFHFVIIFRYLLFVFFLIRLHVAQNSEIFALCVSLCLSLSVSVCV